jgi:hypothetical protein
MTGSKPRTKNILIYSVLKLELPLQDLNFNPIPKGCRRGSIIQLALPVLGENGQLFIPEG